MARLITQVDIFYRSFVPDAIPSCALPRLHHAGAPLLIENDYAIASLLSIR